MNLTEWIISVMEQLGYWGIALLMFLDNVFPPIPSEIIMPSAGYSASQGELILVGVIMSGCIGSLLAAPCCTGLAINLTMILFLNLSIVMANIYLLNQKM